MDLGPELGSLGGWLFALGTAGLFGWGIGLGALGMAAPHAPRGDRARDAARDPREVALVVGRVERVPRAGTA